jgi:hypothetical protein
MDNWTQVGTIGVDSGQVMIIDPCYAWEDDFMPDSEPTGKPYDEACRITLSQAGFGGIPGLTASKDAGFVTRTLHGDGEYPVFVELDGRGHIKRMMIDFDPTDPSTCENCGVDIGEHEDYCDHCADNLCGACGEYDDDLDDDGLCPNC